MLRNSPSDELIFSLLRRSIKLWFAFLSCSLDSGRPPLDFALFPPPAGLTASRLTLLPRGRGEYSPSPASASSSELAELVDLEPRDESLEASAGGGMGDGASFRFRCATWGTREIGGGMASESVRVVEGGRYRFTGEVKNVD